MLELGKWRNDGPFCFLGCSNRDDVTVITGWFFMDSTAKFINWSGANCRGEW